jgi:hypothetical protein
MLKQGQVCKQGNEMQEAGVKGGQGMRGYIVVTGSIHQEAGKQG